MERSIVESGGREVESERSERRGERRKRMVTLSYYQGSEIGREEDLLVRINTEIGKRRREMSRGVKFSLDGKRGEERRKRGEGSGIVCSKLQGFEGGREVWEGFFKSF